MIIFLTGVPGTGKSTIASFLERKGYKWISVNKLIEERHLWTKIENESKIVDLKKVKKELEVIIRGVKKAKKAKKDKNNIIIEGHLVCEMNLKGDLCIVLRTKPRILKTRLEKRKYTPTKIKENLECEIIDYCTVAAEKNLKCLIYEVDTSDSFKKNIKKVRFILENFKRNKRKLIPYLPGNINWIKSEKNEIFNILTK